MTHLLVCDYPYHSIKKFTTSRQEALDALSYLENSNGYATKILGARIFTLAKYRENKLPMPPHYEVDNINVEYIDIKTISH